MEITDRKRKIFTDRLVHWHQTANNRSLPWKEEKDPYRIWLSEIILQQTRALQGLPYYLKLIEAYPDIIALARANDEEVFRLWQGLGYYNRCKHMLHTARYIADKLGGIFPADYEELLRLKGIGNYTAAAIASFAYGQPYAVVDGNVYRVLSRVFGIDTPFDSNEGKKQFHLLAQELLCRDDSAAYNQAIMDFGASVCVPALPLCDQCPLQPLCFAWRYKVVNDLPVRSKRQIVKKRYFHYLLLRHEEKLWIQKRTDRDIWQNLYQPYLVEHTTALDVRGLIAHESYKRLGTASEPAYEGHLNQRLTHQWIESRFFSIWLNRQEDIAVEGGIWVDFRELKMFAFPKTVVSFIEKKFYF